MLLRAWLGSSVVVAAGLFIACSSDTPASTPTVINDDDAGPSTTIGADAGGTQFPTNGTASKYASAVCARLDRCFPGSVANGWGDAATCASAFDASLVSQRAAVGSGITDPNLDLCATKLQSADCSANESEIAECFFRGTIATGQPCAMGYQCGTGSCFFANGDATCGVCTDVVAIGADCTKNECDVGAMCDSDGTGKCLAPIAANGDCSSDTVQCASGLRCIGQKCVAAIQSGAACTVVTVDPCGDGLTCVGGTCKNVPATAKPGETCGNGVGCLDGSCFGGKCVGNVGPGATCDKAGETPPYCQEPLVCGEDGKCAFATVSTCN